MNFKSQCILGKFFEIVDWFEFKTPVNIEFNERIMSDVLAVKIKNHKNNEFWTYVRKTDVERI